MVCGTPSLKGGRHIDTAHIYGNHASWLNRLNHQPHLFVLYSGLVWCASFRVIMGVAVLGSTVQGFLGFLCFLT